MGPNDRDRESNEGLPSATPGAGQSPGEATGPADSQLTAAGATDVALVDIDDQEELELVECDECAKDVPVSRAVDIGHGTYLCHGCVENAPTDVTPTDHGGEG